jgi:hypothetical protein
MNKKQRKTYEAIFTEPIKCNIFWYDDVTLIKALGGTITEGNGLRVRFDLNNIAFNIHSPRSIELSEMRWVIPTLQIVILM